SSLIVFWLAIWGAVGVAYFIWRYVESANRRVYKLATTDQATGLANDYALRELMENGSLFSTERDMKIVGMHLRNLSNIASNTTLKLLNQLLSELGRKLTSGMGEDQYLARLNDGTIILIAPEDQVPVFEQFRQSVNEVQWVGDFQFTLEPTEVQLSYPTDVDSFESLRTAVSQLVASAKKMRIPVLRYDQSLMERSDKLDDYASEISRALHQHEFELYLQPKIDMDERVIVGAETLIRWNHPQDGLLAPGLFMDVVVHSNLRSQFATFVIEETALMAKKLRAEGYMIPLSFNLSADDIFDANVQATLATVAKSLDLQQVPHLEIELIEAQTSINIVRIKEALRLINWLGYTVALDDFGTGMSSLSYSNELPVNTIKIDKSFVDRLLVSEGTEPSIRAIMLLAEGYGFNVVAEGVETQAQAETLRTLGCRVAQGYFYSKPVPFDDFKLLCSSAELSCSSAAGSNTA
ncbi:MAG TPA: EAL domain-containing protein, partial [Marinobacterium sp.]|nr:EAL domain-containing protein [Marinobacterium sp.]